MLFLFESELIATNSLFFALATIYGLGKKNSLLICKKLGFSLNFKVHNLSKQQIYKIIKIIEFLNVKIASNLKKFQLLVSKKLILIKSYRGLRKNLGLPIRGQRTHSNAKTAAKRL